MARVHLFGMLAVVAAVGCSGGESSPNPFNDVRSSLVFIETELGGGSGVLFDDDHHVLTNHHVIAGAEQIEAVLPDGSRVGAKKVGFDRKADVAVLELQGELPDAAGPIDVGASERLAVGDVVYALGFPFEGGVEEPILQMTAGIVSARRSHFIGDIELLQTDASFNFGLSGGALVNENGEYVGMPTLILTGGSSAGLAIITEDVLRIARDIIGGTSDREPLASESGTSVSGSIDYSAGLIAYNVRLSRGQEFRARLNSVGSAALLLRDRSGFEVARTADTGLTGEALMEYEVIHPALYTLVITANEDNTSFNIGSSHMLTRFEDAEDGQMASRGQPIIGELQFSGDHDVFRVSVETGDRLTISLQSWDFDALLRIESPSGEGAGEDDDSGRGLFGGDALLRYTSGESGMHEVTVSSALFSFGTGSGFYRLLVEDG